MFDGLLPPGAGFICERRQWRMKRAQKGAAVEILVKNFGHCKGKVTRDERVTVWLATFYRLSCVRFCKATALLQTPRFAFRKKLAERNSSTCQINNFLGGCSRRVKGYWRIVNDEARKNKKLLFDRRDRFNSCHLKLRSGYHTERFRQNLPNCSNPLQTATLLVAQYL